MRGYADVQIKKKDNKLTSVKSKTIGEITQKQ
jgi:hypothetical protein